MAKTEHVIHDQTDLLPRGRLLVVFAALASGLLIQFIDQNSIGVALPTIGHDLGSSSTIVWAGTSAMIANTAFQVLYGRVSDILGRKVIMIACLCLLGLGDLLCSFARTGPQLYAFRGICGVAQGGIMALAMMIVSDITTLQQRGKYQGILGSCVGLGNTAGPFIAAAFTEHVTWRATYWLLCPLSVCMSVLLYFLLPPQKIPPEPLMAKLRRIDYLGILFSSAGTILILIPISGLGTQFQASDPMVIAMLTIGCVCIALFVVTEWKLAKLPMIPLRLFNNTALAAMMVQNWLIGLCYFSLLYYLPIFYQSARRMSLISSAALLIPMVIPQSISSALAGQYMSRTGRYGEVIWMGYICWTIATGLQCLFSRTFPAVGIAFILILEGIGTGLVFQPTLVAQQAHSPKKDRAVVISARNFLRSLGGACGLAICSPIFSNTLLKSLPAGLPHGVASQIRASIFHLPDVSALPHAQQVGILDAYSTASRAVFYVWVGGMGTCLSLMVFVRDRGLTREEEKEVPAGRPEQELELPSGNGSGPEHGDALGGDSSETKESGKETGPEPESEKRAGAEQSPV